MQVTGNASSFDNMKPPWSIGSLEDCIKNMGKHATVPKEGLYCNVTYDNVLCWPATAAGTTVRLQCPPWAGLDPTRPAYKKCGIDGRWEGQTPGDYSKPMGYTNYTMCYTPDALMLYNKYFGDKTMEQKQMMKDIVTGTRTLEMVGLSLSLITSIVSLFIFSYFRSLRCPRTRIHRNLFVAIIVQIVIRLVLYIDQDIYKADKMTSSSGKGGVIFLTPIFCEMLYVLMEYTATVQFMWMLIEGLYLHNMIAVSVFSGSPNYLIFYLIGWGVPVPITVVWVIVMALTNGNKCWFPYYDLNTYWIISAPRLAIIVINLLFLLNIIRVLITKLRENTQSNEAQVTKVRKAVKAALVLLPLLGITNFLIMIDAPPHDVIQFGIWSYTSYFLVTFQGFFVSLIYCFFNGEVRLTIRKHWERYQQSRVVHSSSLRRLSRSFSIFTSVTEVPPHAQQSRGSTTGSVNGHAVPLLREMIARRNTTDRGNCRIHAPRKESKISMGHPPVRRPFIVWQNSV
ncbi:hypothetical protein ScPMuIL_016018 [Solemya velum]